MDAPSMVHRSGDTLIVRSVVSGEKLFSEHESVSNRIAQLPESLQQLKNFSIRHRHSEFVAPPPYHVVGDDEDQLNNNQRTVSGHLPICVDVDGDAKEDKLPQCKIKRNYSCNSCSYFTQNPRLFLTHLRDTHNEKIVINACKHCLYASRHYQKLVRHMKMVHGTTDGLEEHVQSRKRASQLAREQRKRRNLLTHDSIRLQKQKIDVQLIAPPPYHLPVQSNVQYTFDVPPKRSTSDHLMPTETISLTPTPPPNNPPAPTIPSYNHHLQYLQKASSTPSPEPPITKQLKCTICEYVTIQQNDLYDHERNEHSKTKFFRCMKCSYVTHIKARFSKHVKYHSMPMIKCESCDFRTPYKWNLDRHMKNHNGIGPYKCAACNFTADIKQSLTVHEMNHHIPPVGHASGMSMSRRRNKVGGTDLNELQLSPMNLSESGGDSEYSFNLTHNNNNYDDLYAKKMKLDGCDSFGFQTIPADLSQKSSSSSSGLQSPTGKRASRPIPNLIPIQSNERTVPTALNLSLARTFVQTLSQQAMSEICAKSQHSSLKDLARLFVSEEVFNQSEPIVVDTPQLSPASSVSSTRRKQSNFFDELKEKSTGTHENLICSCGYASKCLSESIIHRKTCKADGKDTSNPVNLSTNPTGSTRCQYCRHRCKSSGDLIAHLQHCMEVQCTSESLDSNSEVDGGSDRVQDPSEFVIAEQHDDDESSDPHPMENVTFVWSNKLGSLKPDEHDDDGDLELSIIEEEKLNKSDDSENNEDEKIDEGTYFGVETAPGYGEVTKKMGPEDEAAGGSQSLKKVFKCPHCSFWASTASRFHVHIVGHLNKKPFECSLCSYRSNWRWDITKHIRLKGIRDPSHQTARVLMNDETGRRNYTKYNKYITLMKVTDEDGDPKLLKSGEMTPMQEAALSYIKNQAAAERNGAANGTNANDLTASFNDLKTSTPNRLSKSQSDDGSPESKVIECGEQKKTSFKCKKCNFQHSNRDVVLSHVKTHYHDAGRSFDEKKPVTSPSDVTPSPIQPIMNLSQAAAAIDTNLYMNDLLSAMGIKISSNPKNYIPPQSLPAPVPSIPISKAHQTATVTSNPTVNVKGDLGMGHFSGTPTNYYEAAGSGGGGSRSVSVPVVPTPIGGSTTSNNIEHGETDEASSMGPSVVVNGWRGPAPYRCGHCHQVSNWKHVIQRHCRLKHNGDIKIEHIEKGSTSNVYQPLVLFSNSTAYNPSESISSAGPSAPIDPPLSTTTSGSGTPTAVTVTVTGTTTVNQSQPINDNSESSCGSLNTEHKFHCGQCSYADYNPDKFMDHVRHHDLDGKQNQLKNLLAQKPERYQCGCNQSAKGPCGCCSVKLDQPVSKSNDSEAIDLTATDPPKPDTIQMVLHFCPFCPARHMTEAEVKYHLSMHTLPYMTYRCYICTFSTREEINLQAHIPIHGRDYNLCTSELIHQFPISKLYPQPHLKVDSNIWMVISSIDDPKLKSTPVAADQSNDQMDLDDLIAASKVPNKFQQQPNSPQPQKLMQRQIEKIQQARQAMLNDRLSIEQTESADLPARSVREEKCPHCPFSTNKVDALTEHMQHHKCVSGIDNLINCDHCDYSVATDARLSDHTKLHFTGNGWERNTDAGRMQAVTYFTRYDNLELKAKRGGDEMKINFPVIGREGSSDKENKILVDMKTGKILK